MRFASGVSAFAFGSGGSGSPRYRFSAAPGFSRKEERISSERRNDFPRPMASRFFSKLAAISSSTSGGQPWPTPFSSV